MGSDTPAIEKASCKPTRAYAAKLVPRQPPAIFYLDEQGKMQQQQGAPRPDQTKGYTRPTLELTHWRTIATLSPVPGLQPRGHH